MGMLELVVRSRLGRDGLIRTSSSLVTHSLELNINSLGRYSSMVEQLFVVQHISVQFRISSLLSHTFLPSTLNIYNTNNTNKVTGDWRQKAGPLII
jgi:hypothetical protein